MTFIANSCVPPSMKHERNDTELLFQPEEDLLSTSVNRILTEAQNVLEENSDASALILNLEHVKSVDSQGLNLLVGLYQESQGRGWTFRVENVSAPIQRLFNFAVRFPFLYPLIKVLIKLPRNIIFDTIFKIDYAVGILTIDKISIKDFVSFGIYSKGFFKK